MEARHDSGLGEHAPRFTLELEQASSPLCSQDCTTSAELLSRRTIHHVHQIQTVPVPFHYEISLILLLVHTRL